MAKRKEAETVETVEAEKTAETIETVETEKTAETVTNDNEAARISDRFVYLGPSFGRLGSGNCYSGTLSEIETTFAEEFCINPKTKEMLFPAEKAVEMADKIRNNDVWKRRYADTLKKEEN